MIRDIELVKKITVKDFEHFLDHRAMLSTEDSLFSRNLFSLKGMNTVGTKIMVLVVSLRQNQLIILLDHL